MDEKYTVSDPTDWHSSSTPLLSAVDASLRCQVCKDFFDAAVITNCAHTFCSKCIRRAIAADGRCPACRTGTSEHQLRRNVAVQEVVAAFETARDQALQVARQRQEEAEKSARETRGAKRKREDQGGESSQVRRTRSQGKKVRHGSSADNAMVIDDSNGVADVDFQPEADFQQEGPDDGLVSCPICSKRMKEEAVYAHLDRCNDDAYGESPQKPSRNTNPLSEASTPLQTLAPANAPEKPPPERLPQLNYSLLKERDLKRKLTELGIPNGGSKDLMSRRHREWVNQCNSNCDSLRPRSKRELLKDLDSWERTQGGNVPFSSSHQGAGVMAKDFDGQGWARQNKSDFDSLIADARKGRQKALERTESDDAKADDAKFSIEMTEQTESAPSSKASVPNGSSSGSHTDGMGARSATAAREPQSQSSASPSKTPAAAPTPITLPSLSPNHLQPKSHPSSKNTDRIPYRRNPNASPVPGFTLPAKAVTSSPSTAQQTEERTNEKPTLSAPPNRNPTNAAHNLQPLPDLTANLGTTMTPTRARTDAPARTIPPLQHSGSASSERSLHEPLASAHEHGHHGGGGGGVRRMPMFEVPGDPVLDSEVGNAR